MFFRVTRGFRVSRYNWGSGFEMAVAVILIITDGLSKRLDTDNLDSVLVNFLLLQRHVSEEIGSTIRIKPTFGQPYIVRNG